MEEGPSKGRGRGRGLLALAQRKAAEAKAEVTSVDSTKTEDPPEDKKDKPVVEEAAPLSLGRGRASFLRQKAAAAAASAASTKAEVPQATESPPTVKGPPITQLGRGRGLFSKPTAASVQAGAKMGQVSHDDAETFRSEEFETSSRIGEARIGLSKELDVQALAQKLQVIYELFFLNR